MKSPILLLLLVAVACSQENDQAGKEAAVPINVLIIVADDQRADSVFGAESMAVSTPSLDRLAAQGSSFIRAYCMGSFSGAVCAPSRAMMLSGKGLPEFHQRPYNPNYQGILLPQAFKQAGYATFATGKWHNGPSWFHRSFSHGDKIFFGGMGPHQGLKVHPFDPSGEYPAELAYQEPGFSSEIFADATIDFLRHRPDDQPFFAWLSFTAPHDPRTPPPGWAPNPEDVRLPDNFMAKHPFDNGEMVIRDETLAATPRQPEEVKQHLADYHGMISHMDAQIGRVLDTLEETGVADNTLVVYVSDHGLAIGSHGLLGKQNLYEHSMRAPLVLRGPGVPVGVVSTALTYLHDLVPTVLDYAGIEGAPLDGEYDGRSLHPLLQGERQQHRRHLLTAYRREQRALTESRFKLIEYGKARVTQLFDLAADPQELHNLAAVPEHASTLTRMRTQLEQLDAQAQMPDLLRRPNIVFLYSDDHAAAAVSAYSQRLIDTPNIDRLANQGIRFTNAFCTNALCGPARAVVLTGQHSHINGFKDNRDSFDASRETFPKILQRAGYQTAVVGKWHLKSAPQGFDYWEVLPGQGHYYSPDFKTTEGEISRPGYNTDIVVDRAFDWLENRRDTTKPFMLMCQFKAPHRSWMASPQEVGLFDDIDIPEPPSLFDDASGLGRAAKDQQMSIARHMWLEYDLKVPLLEGEIADGPDRWAKGRFERMSAAELEAWTNAYQPRNRAFRESGLLEAAKAGDATAERALVRWKYQRYIKDYLRCIKGIDRNVGRVLDKLDELGLSEDTIVVYTSDQGFFLGEHGWYDKRFMYEPSLQVPLLVRWPGVTGAGVSRSELVQNLDFAPTFLDLAGVKVPEWMQGESLVPILKGHGMPNWRESIYYQYFGEPTHNVAAHYGIRTAEWKLIHYPELDEWEMFDLANDPGELTSVHADPEHAAKSTELTLELQRIRQYYEVDQ
ncbi:MAG: hypothetical protein COB96_02775 [Planctomycetota bacterium]|nr:MAG: hypothetical protein COB96_02775 [Planctomycetota bacterium]